MWDEAMLRMMAVGVGETLYMVLTSALFAYAIGLPLGILLVVFAPAGVRPHRTAYKILDVTVNLARSIPFIILLIAILPFTRAVVGTTIGPTATIVPLAISAAPFVARLVESSLKEVDGGVVEAAQSMGATTFQIVRKVLLPEAKPSLLVGGAIATTTILGYSAMAGFSGGGGLGDIAIRFGFYRYEYDVMLVTLVLIVAVVQVLQEVFMRAARKSDKR
mgnify:CR=1 FL=1